MITDFASLIVAESATVNSSMSKSVKLARLGSIYYEGSQYLLDQAQRLLDRQLQPEINSQEDTIVDESFSEFLDGWSRQSVSGNFLDSYLQPRERKSYERSNVAIRNLSASEAVEIFEVDLIDQVLEIAKPEDIKLWSGCLVEKMNQDSSYSFSQLIKLTGLTPGQVFLALVLADCFSLRNDEEDFYGEIWIAFKTGWSSSF
ncbi:MAG: hypothetical protein ACRC80_27185 [Waterburya sp.]